MPRLLHSTPITAQYLKTFIIAALSLMLISGTAFAAQQQESSTSHSESSNNSAASTSDPNMQTKTTLTEQTGPAEDTTITDTAGTNDVSIRATEEGSRTVVRIESSVRTDVTGTSTSGSGTTLKINEQVHQIPENGRFREDIKTENSRTRIRGDIDGSGASISITTNESVDQEGE